MLGKTACTGVDRKVVETKYVLRLFTKIKKGTKIFIPYALIKFIFVSSGLHDHLPHGHDHEIIHRQLPHEH